MAAIVAVLSVSTQAIAQESQAAAQGSRLEVTANGTSFDLQVRDERGYAVISDAGLTRLGWSVNVDPDGIQAIYGDQTVSLQLDTPFFRWNADLLQFVRGPYAENGAVWVPVQLFLDFLPARLPDRYVATGPYHLTVAGGANRVVVELFVESVNTVFLGFVADGTDFNLAARMQHGILVCM